MDMINTIASNGLCAPVLPWASEQNHNHSLAIFSCGTGRNASWALERRFDVGINIRLCRMNGSQGKLMETSGT